MDRALLVSQPYGRDGQALQAPAERPIEQPVQRKLPTLQRPFDSVPAPAQLHHIGQRRPSKASLMVGELTSKHGDEHDAEKIRGTRRQTENQSIHNTRGQIHWLRGQRQRGLGWSRHPPNISNLWPPWLRNW